MPRPATLCRVLWVLCACLVLGMPRAAAAATPPHARLTADHTHAGRVWQSDIRRGFARLRHLHRRHATLEVTSPRHRSVDDDDPADDASESRDSLHGCRAVVVADGIDVLVPSVASGAARPRAPATFRSRASQPSSPRAPPTSHLA
jgi:hypothetical protein